MGFIRKSLMVSTGGVVRGSSKKQRVAKQTLKAIEDVAAAERASANLAPAELASAKVDPAELAAAEVSPAEFAALPWTEVELGVAARSNGRGLRTMVMQKALAPYFPETEAGDAHRT